MERVLFGTLRVELLQGIWNLSLPLMGLVLQRPFMEEICHLRTQWGLLAWIAGITQLHWMWIKATNGNISSHPKREENNLSASGKILNNGIICEWILLLHLLVLLFRQFNKKYSYQQDDRYVLLFQKRRQWLKDTQNNIPNKNFLNCFLFVLC